MKIFKSKLNKIFTAGVLCIVLITALGLPRNGPVPSYRPARASVRLSDLLSVNYSATPQMLFLERATKSKYFKIVSSDTLITLDDTILYLKNFLSSKPAKISDSKNGQAKILNKAGKPTAYSIQKIENSNF